MSRLTFAKDDRVKDLAARCLDTDGSTSPLAEVVELNPCCESLFGKWGLESYGLDERGLAVEHQCAVVELRTPDRPAVKRSNAVAKGAGKEPFGEG